MRVTATCDTSGDKRHVTSDNTVACCLSLVAALLLVSPVVAHAAQNYARAVDQLSQAIGQYNDLSKEQEKYDVVFRRDPMKALVDSQGNLVTSAGLHEGLSVQGIIWSETRPLVVIEDQLFAQGDTIDQYTIREIRRDGVTVQNGSETQFVPLDRGVDTPHGLSP